MVISAQQSRTPVVQAVFYTENFQEAVKVRLDPQATGSSMISEALVVWFQDWENVLYPARRKRGVDMYPGYRSPCYRLRLRLRHGVRTTTNDE